MRLVIAVLIGMTFFSSLPAVLADDWTKLDEKNNCRLYMRRIDYSGRYRNFENKLIGKGCEAGTDGLVVVFRADCEKWSQQYWDGDLKRWSESDVISPGMKGDGWLKTICG